MRADAALDRGDLGTARDRFGRALAAVPGFPDALLGLGHLAMLERRYDDAVDAYLRAEESWRSLGAELVDLQAERYARSHQQVLELEQEIQRIRTAGVPDAGLRASKLENAIARLRSIEPPARDTAGEPPAALYFHLGNALFRAERTDAAIVAWTRCIERDPALAEVYNNLALAFFRVGRLPQAREYAAEAERRGFALHPQFKRDLGLTGPAEGVARPA